MYVKSIYNNSYSFWLSFLGKVAQIAVGFTSYYK